MELHDEFIEEKKEFIEENKKSKKNISKNKVNLERDSLQYNAQELDQEQKVDMNPVQLNTQNLHVLVSNDYSGKITGATYSEKTKEIIKNVNILLYFGHECKFPVHKTNSDDNGNFTIEDLPSGFYTLVAEFGEDLKYKSHYIKVLPCQNVYQSILLN